MSGFVPLASNVNFGSGFNTITLPTFTDLGTFDFFQIINGGTGNSEGQIASISINHSSRFQPLSRFSSLGLACWVCSACAGSGRLRRRLRGISCARPKREPLPSGLQRFVSRRCVVWCPWVHL